MDEHFLNDALGGQDFDCVTDLFLSPNQHSIMMINSTELPRIMGPNICNSSSIHKDHLYNLQLKPTSLKGKFISSNKVASTIKSGSMVVSQGQMTDNAESYGRSTEGFIDVKIQEPENEGELLMVDESVLMIDDPFNESVDGTSLNVNNAHADNSEQDYEGLQDVIQFIRENESSDSADFIALASDRSRNPPYLIKDTINIITKNKEPIKFCLQGADVNQIVSVSMQYTEEKFKNTPVHACKLDQKEDDDFPFEVSPAGEKIELKKDKIHEHPTVHFSLPAENLDRDDGHFLFYITVRCLNSCHKSYGKKTQLIMKLFDPRTNKIIKESRFNIRACKNVKRDFKEAFPEGEASVKRMKRDSFVKPIENQSQPSIIKEEVKPRSRDVNMVMTKPPKPKVPEKEVITCKATKAETSNERKFFLIQLPTPETEKNILETVRLLGGKILNLETVYPVHDNDTNPDLVSDP